MSWALRLRNLPFELEDLILVVWVIALERLLAATPLHPIQWVQGDGVPPGLFVLGGLVLFLVFTRGVEDTDMDRALMRRLCMLGPFVFFLSFYGLIVDLFVRRRREPRIGPAIPSQWPGPLVGRAWRRTAAVPLALIGDYAFRNYQGPVDFTDGINATGVIMAVGDAAIFFFVVAGPRIVAGATMQPWPWLFRFALFAASSWLGYRLPAFLDVLR